ncbi:hypothetical protein DFH08DRAFT_1001291, partial [Mycena albidolilacea]
LFWRQFCALFVKNWIVFSKHPILNLFRCLFLPVAVGIFLSEAQQFLTRPSDFGLGEPAAVRVLQQEFKAGKLVWVDATDGNSEPSPTAIMARITSEFSTFQMNALKKVSTADQLINECPQNFNGFSNCYAAIVFNDIPRNNASAPIQYTIMGDSGLKRIDVVHHNGDYERRVMPLQWAVDQAIMEMKSGTNVSTPLEWSFTMETNIQRDETLRIKYITGITKIIGLAFFLTFLGIVYHLTGAMASERASQVTSHMKAMGLLDSSRIISTHIFFALMYLPSWIIVTFVWHFKIWTHTSIGLIFLINLISGLSLAGWSMFVAAPFGKSPQLAAVASTFFSILTAVLAMILEIKGTALSAVFTIIFPPSFFIFAIRTVDGFEHNGHFTSISHSDPDKNLVLFPFIIINVFLWPCLALALERRLYEAHHPGRPWWRISSRRPASDGTLDPAFAVSARGLGKTFKSLFGREVTAISDLTLDIPRSGIFVLLGSNGAGKSTFLSILGGLIGASRGVVAFPGGTSTPPRGTLGIVPQKNVLIKELSPLQTLRLFRAVKWSRNSALEEDLEQLLRDCDLQNKIHSSAGTLSGGQKRKLQLAIGLVGGSKLVLIDECTSGVDPLSRRAIWRTLVSFRKRATLVLTTHLLDEASLLADHIAIICAPGKLVASGSPVSLKRELGQGYAVQLSVQTTSSLDGLLPQLHSLVPDVHMSLDTPQRPLLHLGSKDTRVVARVLELLDAQSAKYGIVSYDVLGTTIEDIFLDVMAKNQILPIDKDDSPVHPSVPTDFTLANGKPISPLRQALIIFHKRALIVRRSWLAPLVAIAIAIAGSTVPLNIMNNRARSCTKTFGDVGPEYPLYLPLTLPTNTIFPSSSPPGIISALGSSMASVNTSDFTDPNGFTQYIKDNYQSILIGGVSFDLVAESSMFAWEGSYSPTSGVVMLNVVTNILLNRALNASGHEGSSPTLIQPMFQNFALVDDKTFGALEWLVPFCAAMAVFPSFFALYVAKERESSVKTMQLSNGISNPVGLWLGHLLFDSIPTFVMATLLVILFAKLSHQFYGLGLLWFILVLHGIAGTLLAYCMSLVVLAPLSAFAATAAYQFIMFMLYLGGYLLTYTYANPEDANGIIKAIHFSLSLLSPVASVTRAGIISVNLFSLLCDGGDSEHVSSSALIGINAYGGPILYLVLQSIALFTLLFWVDSGSVLFQKLKRARAELTATEPERSSKEDVDLEASTASAPSNLLQVLDATKTYGSNTAVDRLSFGVAPGHVFCMVGPNGAGKTTSINMMSGSVVPDRGDVLINAASVVTDLRTARISLGVCPQFSAIDAQLSVREHLMIYGRLKGLAGEELDRSIESLLLTTGLHLFTDRLAGKLSGGNQRKLSLAIALIGNPPVVLIDEFSTGIDAKIKRKMWHLLRTVARSKAFVITTHSMEEAAALATKVGILAVRLLAVGTTEGLSSRYATYEVHFTSSSPEHVACVERLVAEIPGARMVDDLATRFEVPTANLPPADLFRTLSIQEDFPEYTIEKATLESMFLKVIRENNVQEEDRRPHMTHWWSSLFRR